MMLPVPKFLRGAINFNWRKLAPLQVAKLMATELSVSNGKERTEAKAGIPRRPTGDKQKGC